MSFQIWTKPRARKEHVCHWCSCTIFVGEEHKKYVGTMGGGFESFRYHTSCLYDMPRVGGLLLTLRPTQEAQP